MPTPRRRQPGATIPANSMTSGVKAYSPMNPTSRFSSHQSSGSTRSPDFNVGHSSFRRPPSAVTTSRSSCATASRASGDKR